MSINSPAKPPQQTPTPAVPHIGIFDSGIGGLSVLRAVRGRLPGATITYIADSQYTPWGDRSPAWVIKRCQQLSEWLIDCGAGLVLVACNTATTQAIDALRARWPQHPFVGVEPGIKPAVAANPGGRVAVLATTGTLGSARLRQLVQNHAGGASLLLLPCPGLAEAIELASQDDTPLQAQLHHITAALREAQIDTVVLGCTHYPLVADQLAQRLGPGVRWIDTASAVAQQVAKRLPGGTHLAHATPNAPNAPGDTDPAVNSPALGPPNLRLLATAAAPLLQLAARRWVQDDAVAEALHLPMGAKRL